MVIEKGIEILGEEQYQKDVDTIISGLNSPFSEKVDNFLSVQAEIAKIDRKIERISSAIEDSDESPATLVKRLSELEKQRAEYAQSLQSAEDTEARNHILDEADRLRLSIIEVLKNEKKHHGRTPQCPFSLRSLCGHLS